MNYFSLAVLTEQWDMATHIQHELYERTKAYNFKLYKFKHNDELYQRIVNQVLKINKKDYTLVSYCVEQNLKSKLLFLVHDQIQMVLNDL